MLYLRTGANGSCKSLFTLKDVRDMQVAEGRGVCVLIGKPEVVEGGKVVEPADPQRRYLRIKPQKMSEFGWTECHYSEWWSQPDGTIFLADECHNYLPKRPNGSAVPSHVSKLAEHRSRGMDFFLLTQHPGNIDSFVTKLIGSPGWHQHLKRAFGATKVTSVLQWSAVNNQCEKDGSGKSAQVTMRNQPTEVYDWYDSAELHTGKRKIPRQFWMVAIGAPLAVGMIFFAGKLMWDRTQRNAAPQSQGAVASGSIGEAPGAARDKPMTTAEYVAAYRPRVPGLMHTSPAYDKLTEPKRVPVPAACVHVPVQLREGGAVGCKCYTQDATPYPVDDTMCRQLVAHGAFLAFQPEGEHKPLDHAPIARQGAETALPASPGVVLIDGGGKAPGAPTALAAAAAPTQQPQSRVQPGSKWSFQTGG